MSVQLIVYPQYFNGTTPFSPTATELIIDGIDFDLVNLSTSTQSISGALPQTFINSSTFTVNTWYRFSGLANEVSEASGLLGLQTDCGILQRLSNLTVGATYNLTFDIDLNVNDFYVYQYAGTVLQSTNIISGTGGQTIQFTAASTSDVIALFGIGVTLINNMSCTIAAAIPSVTLNDGQVIVDLYEDEDIPLSLSVDDFKNVAEKVQSYSKAFNLPATKRNNQIFDNIFEITRTDTGLNFNPYKKTKCTLKQDGFLLFEGYLRMIDISNKSGEISYNVNLYSESVALADVLGDLTFADLDFTELEHLYNYTNIIRSWVNAGTGITYTNPSTSGFRDTYTTLRYPFIDWEHQICLGGTNAPTAPANFPELLSLETAFRPTIQLKYLIDRIFQASDFSYESAFFNTADFKKLYMDFNWGSDNAPALLDLTTYTSYYLFGAGDGSGASFATTSFTPMALCSNIPFLGGITPPNYNDATNIITSTVVNETYTIDYTYRLENTDTVARTIECRWLYNSTAIDYTGVVTIAAGDTFVFQGNFTQVMASAGDTLQAQFKSDAGSVVRQDQISIVNGTGALVYFYVSASNITSGVMLQTLRGELGQWEFLKGIMTMFNLVALADESNPSIIKFEPYNDVFLNNDDSKELDWTDKVDITDIRLVPLTELNKNTKFRFVEDEDDYAFKVYKNATRTMYGSKEYDASMFTILQGEEEIIAEPFASTVIKPLEPQFADFMTPAVYSRSDDGVNEGFDNSPRIFYNNDVKTLTSCTYFVPEQNGVAGDTAKDTFLQFSHFSDIPTVPTTSLDFNFETHQTLGGVGTTNQNLFNLYWLPYFNELYNPDTRTMTIKVKLTPSDINTFRFFDTVMIKNKTYRVNKIDYKPNDLATVEFILIP